MTGIYGIDYYNNYSLTGNYGYGYSTGAVSSARSEEKGMIVNPGKSDVEKPGRKSSPAECETCKNRKYIDGSDEANVSFKNAAHVSPEAAGAAVRAHEGQHVSNAYSKASEKDGKVIFASVRIHTAICPECGRSYVSGGVTDTQIKYYNESNPYQQDLKATDGMKARGERVDLGV